MFSPAPQPLSVAGGKPNSHSDWSADVGPDNCCSAADLHVPRRTDRPYPRQHHSWQV